MESRYGAELWGKAPLMGHNFTYLWVTASLMGQSVGGDAVGQHHGVLLWGRAMGQGPTYGSEPHLWVSLWGLMPNLWGRTPLVGLSHSYGSVCRG